MKAVKKSGRLANGMERGKGRVIHLGEIGFGKSLCGAQPGKLSASGWIDSEEPINCPKCLKKKENT